MDPTLARERLQTNSYTAGQHAGRRYRTLGDALRTEHTHREERDAGQHAQATTGQHTHPS